MNLPILILLNLCAALTVFFYASNRLSVKKWTYRQPELWVHTLLVGSSLGVLLTSLWDMGEVQHFAEVMMNISTAVYLGVRAWRKKQQNPPKPKTAKLPLPPYKHYTKFFK